MEKMRINGKQCVVFTEKEFDKLQEKVLAQNELITQLKEEVGL